MDPGPLEREFKKMWNARLEGTPGMLESTLEERDQLDLRESLDMLIRLFGATRNGFLMVIREVDKLNATRD